MDNEEKHKEVKEEEEHPKPLQINVHEDIKVKEKVG